MLDSLPEHPLIEPVGTGAAHIQQMHFYRHLFAYVESAGLFASGARLLEIGSGEGYGANYLVEHAYDVVGVDISPAAVAHASSRYPRARFHVASADALPFDSESFDGVLSFHVIEHVPDVGAYLRECRRVLKSGCRLVLTTPNRRWRLWPFQRPLNPYHLREYSVYGLKKALKPVFPSHRLFGVTASADIAACMHSRHNPVMAYGSTLKYWIGRVLPAAAVGKLERTFRRNVLEVLPMATGPVSSSPVRASSVQDFHLSENSAQGLDLFAVAER